MEQSEQVLGAGICQEEQVIGLIYDTQHGTWLAELNHCGSPRWGSCAVTSLEIGEEFTPCCRTLHNNQGKQAEAGGGPLLSWHWQPGAAKKAGLGALAGALMLMELG